MLGFSQGIRDISISRRGMYYLHNAHALLLFSLSQQLIINARNIPHQTLRALTTKISSEKSGCVAPDSTTNPLPSNSRLILAKAPSFLTSEISNTTFLTSAQCSSSNPPSTSNSAPSTSIFNKSILSTFKPRCSLSLRKYESLCIGIDTSVPLLSHFSIALAPCSGNFCITSSMSPSFWSGKRVEFPGAEG